MNNNINQILEIEKLNNEKEPWLKLNKTVKIDKFKDYVDKYSLENNLIDDEKEALLSFLCSCLDKKKLLKSKEVNYDKEIGNIDSIPTLTSINKKFTLKRCEKRPSTLKSLPPTNKKNAKTIKIVKNRLDSKDSKDNKID